MFSTLARLSTGQKAPNALAAAIKPLLPKQLPPSLSTNPANLYQLISRSPDGGVGKAVHQIRWSDKNFNGCYWIITRSKFKGDGKHGKAWGMLYWRGNQIILVVHEWS
jgi:small subunit ribosomal protein S34